MDSGREWADVKRKSLLDASPTLYLPLSTHTGSLPSWCMVLDCSKKEEPPAERSGKPHMMGEDMRGSESKNFDLTGYEECFSLQKFLSPCAPSSFFTCLLNVLRHFKTSTNRPPFDTSTCHLVCDKNLFTSFHICAHAAELFQLLFQFPLSNIPKTHRTRSSAVRKHHHTSRLHPRFPKNAMDVIPKGEKSRVCPAKYRLTAHYEGFPKTAMWSEKPGRGWYGKMRNRTFNPEKEKKRWVKKLPINVNEGLSQKDFFFSSFQHGTRGQLTGSIISSNQTWSTIQKYA